MARATSFGSKPGRFILVLFMFSVIVTMGASRVDVGAMGADSPDAAIAKLKYASIKVGGDKGSGFHINIAGDFPITEEVWNCLEALPNIKSFWIAHNDIDINKLTRISKIESVESFEVWGYNGKGYGGANIGEIAVLAKLPNLRSLRIIHSGIPSDQGAKLLAFKDHPKLTSLTLNTYVSDKGMQAVGELTQLKEFAMRGGLSSTGVSYLAKLSRLERLHLDAMFSPSWTAKDLKYLSGLKNLQDLTLKETVLTYEDGLEHLESLNLKHLLLRKCIITAPDFSKLQAALPGTKVDRIDFYEDEVKAWNDALAQKRKKQAEK